MKEATDMDLLKIWKGIFYCKLAYKRAMLPCRADIKASVS